MTRSVGFTYARQVETRPDTARLDRASLAAGTASALATISWVWSEFGTRSCVLASMQDAVLIDLAMRIDRRIPVVFLDNGYHFAETHDVLRRVESLYGISIEVVRTVGPIPASVEPGACCDAKVDLINAALTSRDAWLSGLRRSQTATRATASLIGRDRRGKVKANPLAQWSDADAQHYIRAHGIVTHPLRARGYTSIGCEPCTSLPDAGGDRSGRWAGSERTECGLHL